MAVERLGVYVGLNDGQETANAEQLDDHHTATTVVHRSDQFVEKKIGVPLYRLQCVVPGGKLCGDREPLSNIVAVQPVRGQLRDGGWQSMLRWATTISIG